ncbi:MAG: sigma 54-interacting transcriptional regulator [Bradymonadia bacterium]
MSVHRPTGSAPIQDTLELTWTERPKHAEHDGPPIPGVVMVSHAGEPVFAGAPLVNGRLTLGRGDRVGQFLIEDGWISRQHAEIELTPAGWQVADVGSRNGSAIDGITLQGERRLIEHPRVIRLGNSLFLARRDIRPYLLSPPSIRHGIIMGPKLQKTWSEIARAAHFGSTLHITGESGAGKELASRAFHDQGPRHSGPFIAVNCATIPPNLAERLLFGAKKGAYSGADADAKGYVNEAHKGTLFLDEVAELDLTVQAKLLRVLENREVTPLGAARAQPVDLHICSATHRNLRDAVSDGKLREDLYFRLSQPHVELPPLRSRPEEIPMLVDRAVRRVLDEAIKRGSPSDVTVKAHVSLVETCMLRHWPGNVRELMAEVAAAVQTAVTQGSEEVEGRHLRERAGTAFESGSFTAGSALPVAETPTPAPAGGQKQQFTQEQIEAVLREERGNVSRSARRLGLHRTQLRRIIDRYEIDPKAL